MPDLLQWLLGLRQVPDWAAGGSWHIQLQSRPEGLWAVACVAMSMAAVVGVWYLYRTELSVVRPAMRVALVATRLLVLTCVAFMLLELVFVITKRESLPSRLLVLVDTSESMGLNDPYRDDEELSELAARLGFDSPVVMRKQSRLDIARRAIERVLPAVARDREISIYGFAQEPLLLSRDTLASVEAKGTATAIGDALTGALAEHRGQPLAGMLLVSDGQSNAGEDARKAAEQSAKQGVPIVALAVGTEEGPSNARLAAIEADPVVFARDPTEVAVLVEAHGMQGRTGVVVLEKRQDAAWTEVGREEVAFDEVTASRRVNFKITPEMVGEIEFRARISELGTELTEADNFGTHAMKVVRQQIRVLLIAGAPSPEVQFLRNSLLRDTGLEFACWLQSAGQGYEQVGTRPIRRLPANRQELDQYDVLILFDPDMRSLGPAWSDLISQFVGTSGGGLVFVAGEVHTRNLFDGTASDGGDASGSTVNNAWLRTLPVVADPGLYRSNAEVALSAREPWNLELTAEGAVDQIFQFDADPGRNREVLASLPGMYWHFPVTRAKPGATVLSRHGDPRMRNAFGRNVLFAIHRYGPGHSAFLAFDSTYRWRYLHEEYFDGFWARLVDRVGRSKALGGRYPFTLSTDKSVYRTGDQVTIRAKAADASETSSAVLDLRGEVELAGQPATPLEMKPLADQVTVAQAEFTPNEAGAYSVRILPGNVAAESDPDVRPATLNFRVEAAHSELDRPKLDWSLLEDVAKASGGAAFSLAEYEKIPDAFKIKQVHRVLEYRDEMWDAPIVYGSLMVLLTLEWLLRKRSRMA
jgi:hypothetical protein